MAKLEIVPFEPEHLKQMTARDFEAREMAQLGEAEFERRGRLYADLGPAFTGIMEGEILACAGILPLWRGVAEVWLVTTPLVGRYPLAFHRAVRQMLGILEKNMGLWRVQTAIHWRHLVSQKWVKKGLGFRREGGMPGYGPDGEKYIRFARVNGKKTQAGKPVPPEEIKKGNSLCLL